MVAIGENATATVTRAVHDARYPRGDGLHPSTERIPVRRFDDQVGMIALKRVVHEAKPGARASCGEAALQLAYDRESAERRQIRPQSQCHMRREAAEACARRVRYAGIGIGLPPRAASPTAPRPRRCQVKGELR